MELPKRFHFTEFGEVFLAKKYYPKQYEALEALFPNGSFVSLASCNGGGKTTEVIVTAILAHMVLFSGKVIITSGSWAQLKDQLIPALKRYEGKFPAYRFLEDRIETGNPNCFMHAVSTNDAGKFEGHHGSKDNPLMLIIDEAKTVMDSIYGAVSRCRIPSQWCRILLTSSTGFAQGEFYASQVQSTYGLTHPPIRQRASECPHITQAETDAIRRKWGPEHPLVKSMLDCEFMPFVQGSIVQLAELDALLANPPPFMPGERKLFFDAAWSEAGTGDETVLAMRDGNRISIEAAFREKGLHATAGRLVAEFTKLGVKPWEIEGDNGGEGKLIIDEIWKMGWQVGRANFGGDARYCDRYQNLSAEMWVEGSLAITRRQYILPKDTDLYGQMLNRRIVPNNKGLLAIESKLAMKDPNREGGPVSCSPDRADACFGAMAPLQQFRATQVMGQHQPSLPSNKGDTWSSYENSPVAGDKDELAGAWTG